MNQANEKCLICSQENSIMISLHKVLTGHKFSIVEDLKNLHLLTISDAANLRRSLCYICVGKIQFCYEFKTLCSQVEEALNHLQSNAAIYAEESNEEILSQTLTATILPQIKLEISEENVEIKKEKIDEDNSIEVEHELPLEDTETPNNSIPTNSKTEMTEDIFGRKGKNLPITLFPLRTFPKTIPPQNHSVTISVKTTAQIIGNRLIMDGFIYYKTIGNIRKTYWVCKRYRTRQCNARAITITCLPGESITVIKRPSPDDHQHPANQTECQTTIARNELKRAANEHPEHSPSAILCEKLPKFSTEVLAQLPDQQCLTQCIQRIRRKKSSSNP